VPALLTPYRRASPEPMGADRVFRELQPMRTGSMGMIFYAGALAAISWAILRGFSAACSKLGYRARIFDLLPAISLMCLVVAAR